MSINPASPAPIAGAESRKQDCPACGGAFACGARAGDGTGDGADCWCSRLPPLQTLTPKADCLCPACLRAAIARQELSPG